MKRPQRLLAHGLVCPSPGSMEHQETTKTQSMQRSATSLVFCLLSLFVTSILAGAEPNSLSFTRDVRPILADHCYACHGPDEHARQADLRLDERTSALKRHSTRAAIVPRHPEQSELVHRISSHNADVLMPPPEANKPLTADEKQILTQWIAQGALYEKHWAFVPPRRATLPKIPPGVPPASARNAIDPFVLAGLERTQLSPAPPANRETLIRRVTLDLTGLPPTPEEVAAFLQDTSEDAYDRWVDELMRRKTYAERRAQDWLDLARYADTRGFADDKMRVIWPWRDWVIRAIDQNMPFDQFTVEQLAGDMLPEATAEQRLATAFHRNAPQARGMTYPVEEYRIKGVTDRVNTVGRVWLGLTLDCAECHDHKFDPLTQRDYYSLFAIFNNVEHRGSGFGQGGPTMDYRPVSSPVGKAVLARRQKLKAELAAMKQRLPKPRPLNEKQIIGAWEEPTVVADAEKFSLTGDLTITATMRTQQPVANIVSKYDWRGKQRSFVFGIGGEADQESTPGHLFFWVSSRAESFNGVTVYGSQPVNDGLEHHVAVEFTAGKSVRLFVDGIEDKAAQMRGTVPASIAKSNRPLAIGSGYNNSPEAKAYQFQGKLTQVRLSDQALGNQISIGAAGDRMAALLAEQAKLDRDARQKTTIASVPVMRERAQPRETFIHVRGDFRNQGERVSPAAPAVFSLPQHAQPQDRLALARWLVDSQNPLVARVVVNRFWQSYFGQGLVRTPDDFGAQGTPPSHPELLDWLATEFVESGWDMKHIHRLIVTSATYRQSAQITRDAQSIDPENLWLARMPRVRLPAEQIRDQALAASGLLASTAGGPPVFPTQPAGYWERRILPGKWTNSQGTDRHRRTIYTYWRRMALHPSLEVLDAPARENCVVQRNVSNVPTQALVLLNDPIFHEAASALAARVIREAKDSNDADRLERAFLLVLGRSPEQTERTRFLEFIAQQRKDLQADPALTKTSSDDSTTADPLDLAVWTLAGSVLLNLDETITRP